MRVALGAAVGTLWYNDPKLHCDLDGMLALLQKAPDWMADWLFSAAFEGARQVLASIRAHFLDLDLWPLVRVVPGDRSLETFFEEVREDAKFTAGACELQAIIEKEDKDVNDSV